MSLQPAENFFAEVDPPERCFECGREPRADEDALEEWRLEFDEAGERHVFCPACWEREFGEGRMD